jgi:hypothetical protein
VTGYLILAAALVVYVLVCLAKPYHSCSRCRGTRTTRSATGKPRRCRGCDGRGIKARPGARVVHSFYQHVKGEPNRARRMQRISQGQVEAGHERDLGRIDDLLDRVAAAASDDSSERPES